MFGILVALGGQAPGNRISEIFGRRSRGHKIRGFEEETHPILGPPEKHARRLQEEAHQDLSVEISVPRDRRARHFQQEIRQDLGARAPVPLSLDAGVDVCLLCVYASVSVFAFGKQELF